MDKKVVFNFYFDGTQVFRNETDVINNTIKFIQNLNTHKKKHGTIQAYHTHKEIESKSC